MICTFEIRMLLVSPSSKTRILRHHPASGFSGRHQPENNRFRVAGLYALGELLLTEIDETVALLLQRAR